MKSLLLILFSSFVAFSTTQASADHHKKCERKAGKQESEKHEMHADTNNDGKVSFEEFKSARIKHMEEHFKRRDTNGDGFIDAEEKKAARAHHKKHHDKESCKRKKADD